MLLPFVYSGTLILDALPMKSDRKPIKHNPVPFPALSTFPSAAAPLPVSRFVDGVPTQEDLEKTCLKMLHFKNLRALPVRRPWCYSTRFDWRDIEVSRWLCFIFLPACLPPLPFSPLSSAKHPVCCPSQEHNRPACLFLAVSLSRSLDMYLSCRGRRPVGQTEKDRGPYRQNRQSEGFYYSSSNQIYVFIT